MRCPISIGQRIGTMTVESLSHVSDRRYWNVLCDCGKRSIKSTSQLNKSKHRIQFCSHDCKFCVENNSKKSIKHGMARHSMYFTWKGMKQRCLNNRDDNFPNYGGRGISVCDEWMTFDKFYQDMANSWSKGLQLDRINNNGNYCKENCRWVTNKLNSSNKRNSILSYEQIAICEKNGISAQTAHQRRKMGMSIHDSITTPLMKVKKPKLNSNP